MSFAQGSRLNLSGCAQGAPSLGLRVPINPGLCYVAFLGLGFRVWGGHLSRTMLCCFFSDVGNVGVSGLGGGASGIGIAMQAQVRRALTLVFKSPLYSACFSASLENIL